MKRVKCDRLARLSRIEVTERTVYNWVGELEELRLLSPGEYEQRSDVAYTIERFADDGCLGETIRIEAYYLTNSFYQGKAVDQLAV